MKNILFAIFTCNRLHYLKNCLNSIVKFVDLNQIDILVCDNLTVETGFQDYMNLMNKNYNIMLHQFKDRTRNELYRAMNFAIDFAKKQSYEIINFVQDDYQYLYKRDAHLREVRDILSQHPNIVQVNTNLVWRRKNKKIGKIGHFKTETANYGKLYAKFPCDNGFTRVSAYEKIGSYPTDAISWGFGKNRYVGKVNGEVWFGQECKKRGWSRCLSYYPNLAMMFDCAYVRGDERYGRYFPPSKEFYLKELFEVDIERISKNNEQQLFSFIEEYCVPDGWTPKTLDKHSPSTEGVSIYE